MGSFGFLQIFFEQYGLIAVFVVLLACGLGVPIPEDITLVTGGIISGLGYVHLYWMMLVCFAGVLVGDSIIFIIGYIWGERLLNMRFFQRIISPRRLKQAERKLEQHGNLVIFTARFLPGLRMPIFMATGICRTVSYWRFLMLDGFAALISVPIWVYLGDYGAENLDWLVKKVHQFQLVVIIIVCLLACYLVYHFWRRARRRLKLRQELKHRRLMRRQRLAQAKKTSDS